jgi:hypothetical protein
VTIALAMVAVALGAALAVPSARSALLEWLGLEGVSIVRVEKLPPAPVIGHLDLGQTVTLEQARSRAPWLVVPSNEPDSVYLSRSIPGGKVTLLWGTPQSVRLLLTEFRGTMFLEKMIRPEAKIEPVTVNGRPGAWLAQPHVVMFNDEHGQNRESTARLAGKTLIWQLGDVTLRLEGDLSKEQALHVARSAD